MSQDDHHSLSLPEDFFLLCAEVRIGHEHGAFCCALISMRLFSPLHRRLAMYQAPANVLVSASSSRILSLHDLPMTHSLPLSQKLKSHSQIHSHDGSMNAECRPELRNEEDLVSQQSLWQRTLKVSNLCAGITTGQNAWAEWSVTKGW